MADQAQPTFEERLDVFQVMFRDAQQASGIQAAYLVLREAGGGKVEAHTGGAAATHALLRKIIADGQSYRRWTLAKWQEGLGRLRRRFGAWLLRASPPRQP